MLIVTRKAGEQVVIDRGTIQIRVLGVDRGKIRLGFTAPKNIDIDREEIYLKKQEQQASLLTDGVIAQ